jgi:hypothetical protein
MAKAGGASRPKVPWRGRTALAYDSARKQVVLFGGVREPPAPRQPQTFLSDTWIWDGADWTQAAVDGPRGRYAHGMAYDERAGAGDTWECDGKRWRKIE